MRETASRGLHRFAVLLACCVVVLIAAGALVKSKEAGLSVPDWPLSYGSLNPPRWWEISNVRAEHGHRLIAGTVALMTVALAVGLQRREERRWVRRLGWGAVAAVLAQAVLGGLTVLFFLPPAISISHAALAQLFLGLVVSLAVVTSRSWTAPEAIDGALSRGLRGPASLLVALVYVQILLGAVVRHVGAGLAIPDFPLVFGALVPPRFDFAIGIHYAHRLGALTITAAIVWIALRAARAPVMPRGLGVPVGALVALVSLQVLLGGTVVWTGRAVFPNTLHVGVGAALLATSLVLALRARRSARVVAARRALDVGRGAAAAAS